MEVEQAMTDDFLSFYRAYARTGIHAAAAALLTLFGLLATIAEHWAFVGVGVAIYVLPPAYLYLTQTRSARSAANVAVEVPEEDDSWGTGSSLERTGPERGGTSDGETGTRATESSNVDTTPAAAEPTDTDAAPNRSTDWQWRPTTPPTDADLVDATATADGASVVGTGGVLLARRDEDWEMAIEDGAGGDGNDFTAVDATTDGRVTWAVGDGGAVARYEVDAERHVDLSAPNDLTSTWTGVAVAGPADEETVYLANGSGVVLRGVMVDGDVTWGDGRKPGSGSSVADLAFPVPRRGVVCDTAGEVFETTDGNSFERVGVDDPDGTLTSVIAGDGIDDGDVVNAGNEREDDVLSVTVADDDGSLHRRGRAGWTRDRPTDAALFGLAAGNGERLAVGEDGTILDDGGDGWESESAPVDATLRGAALPGDGPALAVGDGGTAVERPRETADDG